MTVTLRGLASTARSASVRAYRVRRPLRWTEARDAFVVPFLDPYDPADGAGVVAREPTGFRYVPGTGLRRYFREIVAPPTIGPDRFPSADPVPRAIFGGFVLDHFGHFLLEGLARLWVDRVVDIDASVPLVWIALPGARTTNWMMDVCRRVGLGREVVLLDDSTGPLAVEELLVPQAGFELREWMHPQQLQRLGTTPWCPSGDAPKVWLSRSWMGDRAGYAQEAEVEHELRRVGWTIVHPESLTIDEQIDLLAGASHVAGVEGSALHGLVLVDGFGGTIDILRRRDSPNFGVLARVGGWDQRLIDPIGGRRSSVLVRSDFTGVENPRVTIEAIDPVATAETIDRSSRRRSIA